MSRGGLMQPFWAHKLNSVKQIRYWYIQISYFRRSKIHSRPCKFSWLNRNATLQSNFTVKLLKFCWSTRPTTSFYRLTHLTRVSWSAEGWSRRRASAAISWMQRTIICIAFHRLRWSIWVVWTNPSPACPSIWRVSPTVATSKSIISSFSSTKWWMPLRHSWRRCTNSFQVKMLGHRHIWVRQSWAKMMKDNTLVWSNWSRRRIGSASTSKML